MENFRFELSKRIKITCPSCFKQKCFVPYIDKVTSCQLHSTVGKCDRQDNCGHHYTPSQYFSDNHFDAKKEYSPRPAQAKRRDITGLEHLYIKPQPSYIDSGLMEMTLKSYEQNKFSVWLASLVGQDKALEAVKRYNVGTTKSGGTIFWQVDLQGRVRAGKIIAYNDNGHRRKDLFPPIQWVHSILKMKEFNLFQCLFGEHLLSRKNTPVAIVFGVGKLLLLQASICRTTSGLAREARNL